MRHFCGHTSYVSSAQSPPWLVAPTRDSTNAPSCVGREAYGTARWHQAEVRESGTPPACQLKTPVPYNKTYFVILSLHYRDLRGQVQRETEWNIISPWLVAHEKMVFSLQGIFTSIIIFGAHNSPVGRKNRCHIFISWRRTQQLGDIQPCPKSHFCWTRT